MVELAYRYWRGGTVFIREWVPVNPDRETLAGSRPIQTKWGKGYLLTHAGQTLSVLWVDIGPLRASVYTNDLNIVSREQLLEIAETLGPASNRQVFSFSVERPVIKDVPPPPPYEAKLDDQGVQQVNLIITPGGYSPLRFAVRKGVPVKLTFRQLGQVGCGNELIFPADPQNPIALRLASEHDKQVLEFTPQQTGEFQFFCSHYMYRGVMTVKE
jgi:hypothetical protein